MTFYSPPAFLFLLAIPAIILLYLLKQRHQDFEISSLYLWQEVLRDIEANAPWQKLKRNLLMLLQILAVLLLVFAMAKPFLNRAGGKAANVVVVMDTSMSMQATDVKPSRFEAAKKQAESYISNLRPGTLVTLINMGESAVIEENLSADKSVLLEKLRGMKASNGTADTDDAASLVQSIDRQYPGTEVVIFGDAPLEIPGVAVKLSSFSDGGANYAVGQLSHTAAKDGLTVLSRISNYGTEDAKLPVSLYADGKVFDARNVEVKKGGTVNIYWNAVPAGTLAIECRLDVRDFLDADNTAWDVVNPAKNSRAMLVTFKNIFIEKALSLMNGIELFKTGSDSAEDLKGYDLYIFDGYLPDRLPQDGSIMIFNPPQNNYFTVDGDMEQPAVQKSSQDIFRYISDSSFYIGKSRHMVPPGWGEPVLQSDKGVLAFSGILDNRRVIVWGFDLHDTDLALRPAFPIVMNNALEWLLPSRINNVDRILPGDGIEFNLDPKALQAAVKTPSGGSIRVAPPFPAGAFDRTGELGVYALEQKLPESTSVHYFSVNAPVEKESNLASARQNSKDTAGAAGDRGIPRGMSLQWLLLWMVILVLLIEWWVYANAV